jgi:TRAP-type uncharacterized transport system fused permease subunit
MPDLGEVPRQSYPSAPGWQVPSAPRVPRGVLIGVSLWRLVIVAFAMTGFVLAMNDIATSGGLPDLSQQASLLTAACYLVLLCYPAFTGWQRHEPNSPWLRGALTVLLGLVCVTFLALLGADLTKPWSLFEHLLTPLVVVVDWLFVGRDQRNARWWYPFTWLALPLVYLVFYLGYVGNGAPLYPFLDPRAGDFVVTAVEFLAAVLAFGFVVLGLGRLRSRP